MWTCKCNKRWIDLEPHFRRNRAVLYVGHVLDLLRRLPAESVDCVVTSPPYYGLRAYGTEPQPWGDGWRGELGSEPTLDMYLVHLVEVFREVRRVLAPWGTAWVNMGDSYNAYNGNRGPSKSASAQADEARQVLPAGYGLLDSGLKPKDLLGVPWRLAFALQADGWWLRSDIVWHKPNPMPESVTDRPTKSHEYLFLLTKSARYYYDAEAIAEPAVEGTDLGLLRGRSFVDGNHVAWHAPSIQKRQSDGVDSRTAGSGTRNARSVWTIPTEAFPEAHFATYPTALVEPCVKAGTSERGNCPDCRRPWVRVVKHRTATPMQRPGYTRDCGARNDGDRPGSFASMRTTTLGWRPTCEHESEPVPALVLDPFAGSGTTLLVAQRLGRIGIGLELNPEYADIAARRLSQEVLPL